MLSWRHIPWAILIVKPIRYYLDQLSLIKLIYSNLSNSINYKFITNQFQKKNVVFQDSLLLYHMHIRFKMYFKKTVSVCRFEPCTSERWTGSLSPQSFWCLHNLIKKHFFDVFRLFSWVLIAFWRQSFSDHLNIIFVGAKIYLKIQKKDS